MYQCAYKKLCKIRMYKLCRLKGIVTFLLVLVVTSYRKKSQDFEEWYEIVLQRFKAQQISTTIMKHVTKNCHKTRISLFKNMQSP